MAAQTAKPPRISEKKWQAQVVELAGYYGWELIYHPLFSKGSAAGWPDLVLLRPPEALFVELKTEKGKVTDAQDRWLAALALCGLEVHVWRPSQFDEIHERLKRKPARRRRAFQGVVNL